jgi:hypothetical protein
MHETWKLRVALVTEMTSDLYLRSEISVSEAA